MPADINNHSYTTSTHSSLTDLIRDKPFKISHFTLDKYKTHHNLTDTYTCFLDS